MAIWNLGSINADMIYDMPHLPQAGETLAARGMARFLGGKGANMSVAAARAAAHVRQIGAVGPDGRWAVDRLLEYGVDTRFIREVDTPTGHAIIAVDPDGENQIILLPGANRAIPPELVTDALAQAQSGDSLLLQNETSQRQEAAALASAMGLRVCYAAAPFDAGAVMAVLPHLDFLILNRIEAAQLADATGKSPADLPVRDVIVTLGADGCHWFDTQAGTERRFDAVPVTPVDTTGAGDTFTGFVLAALDRGQPMGQAITLASHAAAIMVTRHGTADVIPDLKDIEDARLG